MNDLDATIDHTLLLPQTTAAQIDAATTQAMQYGFACVCVNGCFIEQVAEALAGSTVKPCAVAGFPLGAMQPAALAHEAGDLVRRGSGEIDFVAPLRYLMTCEFDRATQVMRRVVDSVRDAGSGIIVKVIIESAALMQDADANANEQRIAAACDAAQRAGCDFVKTSTGFHQAGGATVEAVALMRKFAGDMQVKASGGIRTFDDAKRMLDAGADRLGCSAGVAIVTGARESVTASI
jgi:deoxyribose-phosphate aldolase